MMLKAIRFTVGLFGLLLFTFAGVEIFLTPSSYSKKNSFSHQEARDLITRYIPPEKLLTVRYMLYCLEEDADMATRRALLKRLAYADIDADQITDEEVITICYFISYVTI